MYVNGYMILNTSDIKTIIKRKISYLEWGLILSDVFIRPTAYRSSYEKCLNAFTDKWHTKLASWLIYYRFISFSIKIYISNFNDIIKSMICRHSSGILLDLVIFFLSRNSHPILKKRSDLISEMSQIPCIGLEIW